MPYKNIEDGRKNKREYYHAHKEERLEYCKQWNIKNRDSVLTRHKEYYATHKEYRAMCDRKRKYGITQQEYNALFVFQNGNCAICGRHQSTLTKRLHVDHDHNTKKIRGLLCHYCNLMLGNAMDNTDTLQAAVIYLKGGE